MVEWFKDADREEAGPESSPEYLISDLDLIDFGEAEPEPEKPGTSKEALKQNGLDTKVGSEP